MKLTDSGASSETGDARAIVVWLLKSIESGFSNNSNDDIGDVLRSMDPNSKVLQSFRMKKLKRRMLSITALLLISCKNCMKILM